jgi:hypothetical protein
VGYPVPELSPRCAPVSVLVSVGFAIRRSLMRVAARERTYGRLINTCAFRLPAFRCRTVRNGLVGINSEVSYQLDHAPAVHQL